MEALLVLLALYLFLALVVFPIWAYAKFGDLTETLDRLRQRFDELQTELHDLRVKLRARPYESPAPAERREESPAPATPTVMPAAVALPPIVVAPVQPVPSAPTPVVEPPKPVPPVEPVAEPPPSLGGIPVFSEPPLLGEPQVLVPEPESAEHAALRERAEAALKRMAETSRPVAYTPPPPAPSWMDNINWEQFMGAKLFAWLGGLALFLGVAFFVKYSFEHDLIPPAMRVAIGFVIGAGLVVGGLRTPRDKYAITAQTLIAAGIVSLYVVTFACNSIYHFAFFSAVPTFLLMTLITATAFIIAVRLEAQVVAILGILGGFLTPILINTGQDNPGGLFGYLALLDLGLVAVAVRRSWFYLVPLGAGGTVMMMAGWAGKFYAPEKTVTAMTVCLGFSALFIGAAEVGRRLKRVSPLLSQTAIALPAVAFFFAWYFLDYPTVAARTGLFFGYVFLVSAAFFFLAWREQQGGLVAVTAGVTAALMIRWATQTFTGAQTPVAMTVCLVFCVIYLLLYLAARRLDRVTPAVYWAAVGLPVVALGFAWFFLGYAEAAGRTGLFFGFVFVVSLFVMALAWWEGMGRLVAGVAGITALLMVRWAANTFKPEQAPVVVTVCLVFAAIYFAVYLLARRWERATPPVMWATVFMPGVALAFALWLMSSPAVGAQPGLLFGFILAADGLLLALAWLDERLPRLHLVAGLAVFGLLSVWTTGHLTNALLPWALAMYLVFAALHTVFPLVLQRHRPAATPTWWSQLFPPLTLVLMLLPIFRLETVSFLLWPAILLVDLIAIALAVLSASLAAVAAVLVLTLLATGLSIFRVPVAAGLDLSLLLVIGGFAVFFFVACLWLVRKLGDKLPAADRQLAAVFGDSRAQLPAFASLLPFLLLIMACARLPVPDPSALFGLGLLLVVLTLGLARLLVIEWLPACALTGIAGLELVWHTRHFDPAAAGGPLAWYAGFYAVFAVYPFVFRREFARLTGPWAVAALGGLAHFWMVYRAVKLGWPGSGAYLGVVPALFAVAPLASLFSVLKQIPADNPKRLNQLAWFGGVALFFITLIFPIQFERQWLTVAWALEGAALLWLFHRVPHPGLRAVGAVLLVTAFVRLALNPAVLGYHVRGDIGILNWYLFAYGLATAALFAGARLAAPPRHLVLGVNVPPLFNTLGAILAFILLNIEIADYFTAPGVKALAFQFTGNFGRDMTYTIGWALFALGLLGAGIRWQTKAARYAAITLLSIALLKLFFHDLARLEALYRIGALFAVAVIAMLASFAYQRFLPGNEKSPPPGS